MNKPEAEVRLMEQLGEWGQGYASDRDDERCPVCDGLIVPCPLGHEPGEKVRR